MEKLKACRKCNREEWIYVFKDNYDKFGTGNFVVLCQDCGIYTEGKTEQAAISAWNKRS